MILATASLLLSASQPSLCFVARFYKSGNAKSKFELFVSDLSGGDRRLLPTTEEPMAAQWIGHDRLAWFSEKGLWTSKLSPWKPVQIKKTTSFHFEESRLRSTEPGMPDFVEDFDRSRGVFALNPTTLKLERSADSPHHEEIELTNERRTSVPHPNAPDHPLMLQQMEDFTFWDKGKMVPCGWELQRAFNSDAGAKLWLVVGTHSSTSGQVNGVLLLQKGKDMSLLFEDANCFDLIPQRSTFAYCTDRETMSMGKKEVWTSELHVGDWKKGSNRAILKGLVWVPSVSIRP